MGLTTKEISSSSFNDMISSVDRRSEYVENRAGANVRLNNFLTPYTLDDKSSILNAPCGYSNGVYPSLRPIQTFGPELIDLTQGTAEQPLLWSNITTNSVNFLPGAAGTRYFNIISTQGTLVSGKKYSLTLQISNYSGSDTLGLSTQGGVSINARFDTNTTHSEVFTSNGQFLRIFGRATNSATITLSVKEVIDADFDFTRGSAATRVTKDGLIKNVQILSDELVQNGDFEQIGSELVVNGDFSDNSWWGLDPVWSISGGSANCIGSGTIYKGGILTIGKTYKVQVEISSYTSGTLTYPNASYTLPSAVGSYTFYYKANSQTISFTGSSFTGSIDNVSVKEVGQNWTFGGEAIIDNGLVSFVSASNTYSYIRQDISSLSASLYRISVEVKNYVSGAVQVGFSGSSPNFQNLNVSANGVYTVELSPNANGDDLEVSREFGGGAFDFDIDNVSVVEVTDDTDLPRIDYTNGTGSLLLEPQSTNLLPYSERFNEDPSNNRFNYRVTTVENSAISPSGDLNATSLIEDSTTNTHVMRNTVSITQNLTYTFSVFAKLKSGDRYLRLCLGSSNFNATFNLINKTLVDTTNAEGNIEEFGNDWVRLSVTGTPTSSSYDDFDLRFINSNTDSDYYAGDGTSGFYVWGAQLEAENTVGYNGEYPTSYIPTSVSTVTRNADVCNNAGSSDLINSTEGVLYFEGSALANDSTNRWAAALSDGTNNERVQIIYLSDNSIAASVISSNISQCSFNYSGSSATNFNKIAISYKQNDFKMYVNGVQVDSDTSGNAPSGLDTLGFERPTGVSQLHGKVRSVAVFKEALTDEELAKITSTTQQEVFYEMRDKMLQIDADYYEFGDYTTRLKKLF